MSRPPALPGAHARLAAGLLRAVREQDFGATADALRGLAPVEHFPSVDIALAVFAPGPPRWANVLFSREHPRGLVAEMSGTAGAGAVANVAFDADQRDAAGTSVAWLPGADWGALTWQRLHGEAGRWGPRCVAPYPASLLKLMVAVAVGLLVDRGACGWPGELEPMLVDSDNDATSACVALLHRHAGLDGFHARCEERGLTTLRLEGTRPGGGWRNADGAGVGRIHMTAWDTVRLLWLLDADAPSAPWLPSGTPPLLQPTTRDHVVDVLRRQRHDHVLSSGSLRGLPGWIAGLPDAPAFAHKTGSTENYASDAGIVRTPRAHYLVAVLTNLGSRYAPHPGCVTTWRLPALGAAVHRLVTSAATAIDAAARGRG